VSELLAVLERPDGPAVLERAIALVRGLTEDDPVRRAAAARRS